MRSRHRWTLERRSHSRYLRWVPEMFLKRRGRIKNATQGTQGHLLGACEGGAGWDVGTGGRWRGGHALSSHGGHWSRVGAVDRDDRTGAGHVGADVALHWDRRGRRWRVDRWRGGHQQLHTRPIRQIVRVIQGGEGHMPRRMGKRERARARAREREREKERGQEINKSH